MRLDVLIAIFAGVGAPAVLAFVVPTRNNAPLSSLNMAESSSANLSRADKIRQQIQQEISDVEAERGLIQKQIADAETQRETLEQQAAAADAEVAAKLKKLESVQARGGAGAINLGSVPIFLAGGIGAIAAGRATLAQREIVRLEEEIARAEGERSTLEVQQAQASSVGVSVFLSDKSICLDATNRNILFLLSSVSANVYSFLAGSPPWDCSLPTLWVLKCFLQPALSLRTPYRRHPQCSFLARYRRTARLAPRHSKRLKSQP
jgi:hypothetical protein